MSAFNPHPLIRNGHVQSILASSGLRRPLLRRRGAGLLANARPLILDAGEGVRLHGLLSRQPGAGHAPRETVILIHGWEGCAESNYLLSAAGTLYQAGYDVFRLHLRDHGPTHHLNAELFHAARLDEVVNAVRAFEMQHADGPTCLVGFSLGGNFALRVASQAQAAGLRLRHVVAVSPAIKPLTTMAAMEQAPAFYHQYFVRKWQRSLSRKHELFPGLLDYEQVRRLRRLRELTDYLVEHHTDFTSAEAYLNSYEITPQVLADITCPVDIITAEDDPVIPAQDFYTLQLPPQVRLRMLPRGGHCGFVKDLRLQGWIDEELLRLFGPVSPLAG
jgi:hypothetical protein